MQLKDNDAGASAPSTAVQPEPAILQIVVEAMLEASKGLEGIAPGYTVGGDNGVQLGTEGGEGPTKAGSCRDHHSSCGNWAKWVSIGSEPEAYTLYPRISIFYPLINIFALHTDTLEVNLYAG